MNINYTDINILKRQIRPIILAIDFDSTIANYGFPDISQAILLPYAKEIINQLYDLNYYIIIWTCRYKLNHISDCINFLNNNNIKFHAINQNYSNLEFKPIPKIFYDILIDDRAMLKIDWLKINEFIQQKSANIIECKHIITQEMIDWYIYRTENHINLVKEYGKRICDLNPRNNRELYLKLEVHDLSKFNQPELEPYIILTWDYYCKDHNIAFNISNQIKNKLNKATEHHIKTNEHHPEYWSDQTESLINNNDRDSAKVKNIIDVTKMPNIAIAEMVADWCATSKERGNSPEEWANKVINKRWKFSNDQIKLIYELIDNIY